VHAAALPALGLAAGTLVGWLLPEAASSALLLALGAAACRSVWAWRSQSPRGFLAAVSAAFVSGGALLVADAWREAWQPSLRVAFDRRSDESERAAGVLTGRLREDGARTEAGVSLSLDVVSLDEQRVEGGVLLTVSGDLAAGLAAGWRAGRLLRMPVELRRPTRYWNPGGFDEERGLARRGAVLVGSVKSGALVEVVEPGSAVAEAAASARAHARAAIAAHVGPWSPRSAGIVTAIVIGDRSGLGADVRRRLQEAGTYHVIAISGGNIAILAGLALGLFRLCGVPGRTAAVAAIAGLCAYAVVVGASGGASVERATLMAVAHLLGRAIDLRGPPGNSLAVAVGLLVAAQPLSSVDPAFLLTCGATAGILAVLPIAAAVPCPRLLRPPLALLAASVAAEVVLMPVGAYFFSRVTLAGLVLNFAAIPLMAVAQVAGMAIVPATMLVPAVAPLIGWLAHVGAEGLVRSADATGLAPALAWRVAPPGLAVAAIYYAGITAWWLLPHRRARRAAAACAIGTALWIVAQPWTLATSRPDGRLRVTFFDVGQGDATLVRFPRGATLLVDAGGLATSSSFDVGDRVVAPALRWYGIRRLDTVAITHAHPDHVGGLPAIVREFGPRDVWEGVPVPPLAMRRTLEAEAVVGGARWVNVQSGDRLRIDGVDVLIHHPPLPDWERQDVRNDDSLVIELRWGDVSVVLTGDIGREVEQALLGRLGPARLRVWKVAHHGSLTSSGDGFLDGLRPQVAVVSAGRSNRFGHPAPEVLGRYERVAAHVFRTDRDGAVTVTSDGRSVGVETVSRRSLDLP
jgi:competence protein ComEC